MTLTTAACSGRIADADAGDAATEAHVEVALPCGVFQGYDASPICEETACPRGLECVMLECGLLGFTGAGCVPTGHDYVSNNCTPGLCIPVGERDGNGTLVQGPSYCLPAIPNQGEYGCGGP
jgi:hypothetical protein